MRDKGEHLGIYHVGTTEESHDRRSRARVAAHGRPRDRVDRNGRRRPAAPSAVALTSRNSAKLGYKPKRIAGPGPAADDRLVLEQRKPRAADLISKTSQLRQAKPSGDIAVFPTKVARAAGTGGSVPVECCQICGHEQSMTVLSLGYMPPVNQMVPIGAGAEDSSHGFRPICCIVRKCELVQLGLAVDPVIIFPPEYPYTSGTTRLLRDNFADLLCRDRSTMLGLGTDDLVIDIGSNDGTLISNFQKGGHRVLGIEPTDVGEDRQRARHPDVAALFLQARSRARSRSAMATPEWSRRRIASPISRTSMRSSRASSRCSTPDGVFISESHYLIGLLDDAAIRHRLSRTSAATIRCRQPRLPA